MIRVAALVTPILCFLFLVMGTSFAQAEEVIHSYDTHIKIDQYGTLHITETIEVTAEGRHIKRGIFRDFPLQKRTFLGGALSTIYNIESVKRDGKDEPYHFARNDRNLRLYIGKSSYHLPKGQRYEYEIKYNVPRQITSFEAFDELNWNVIGTGWSLPIMTADAKIILPGDAEILNYSVYTGKALSREGHYRAYKADGKLQATITKPLQPHEGMTIAISFPKGHIAETDNYSDVSYFMQQHYGLLPYSIALLATILFYLWAWNQVGRDPASRGLAPFYEAPEGISPAMAAYILHMGGVNEQEMLTATILSLASKGYLTIEELEKEGFRLKRVELDEGAHDDRPAIAPDEQVVYDEIKSSLTVKPRSSALQDALIMHQLRLPELCVGKYFDTNAGFAFLGVLPLIVATFYYAINAPMSSDELMLAGAFGLGFGMFGFLAIMHSLVLIFKKEWSKAIGLIVFGGAFFGFGLMMILQETSVSLLTWLMVSLIFLVITFMRKPMMAPTRMGQEIRDHVAGLKYYMEMVEEKVLQKFDPPEMSRELFEKYLPYAVALGVESKWAERFENTVARASASESQGTYRSSGTSVRNTSPSWYSGKPASGFSVAAMTASIGSAVAASSTSPSGSSSGGGFSGGGGGGGGGGGW